MTPFAAWQERMGLTSSSACAAALGLSRQSVWRLSRGHDQPHPSTTRLMEVLEEKRKEHAQKPS